MRVLVCGSRTFSDYPIVERFLLSLVGTPGSHTIIEGGEGFVLASHEQYPANWDIHGKAAGPIRNQRMLDAGKPDPVIAFVDKPLRDSRGTSHMVGLARQAGLPVYVIQVMAPGRPDPTKATEF